MMYVRLVANIVILLVQNRKETNTPVFFVVVAIGFRICRTVTMILGRETVFKDVNTILNYMYY